MLNQDLAQSLAVRPDVLPDHSIDTEYTYQPAAQLSLRERARLLIMRVDVSNGAYADDMVAA